MDNIIYVKYTDYIGIPPDYKEEKLKIGKLEGGSMKKLLSHKYFRWIVGLFMVIVLVSGVYINKRSEKKHIPYNEFIDYVTTEQVDEVTISNSSNVLFKLKGDNEVYITDNPRTLYFKENLLLKGINVIEANQNSSAYIIEYIMSGALLFGIYYMVVKGSKNRNSAMSLANKQVEMQELKVDFSDIAGNVEAKEQVQDIVDFIKQPQKYAELGARMPKGVILYGPPGTGKTLMAKAIAKEANVPFFSVNGSDFVQLYVGVGASRVREIFKEARKHKKAVIFIDEIDAIGKKRSSNPHNSNDEKDQTLNALLTEMSGFKEDEGIVVIAATNRLDMLDEALLRAGRFDRHVEVGYPDVHAREQIIRLYLKNKPVSEEVDPQALARQTVYFTGAMIESLLNEAAILAAKRNIKMITEEDIQTAFYIVIAGMQKKDRSSITSLDRQITAFHEAGHALITKLVAPDNTIAKVTIIPSTRGAGGFSMNIPKDKMYLTKSEILGQIKISLAGRAAEELVFGSDNITTGASNDIEKASSYIKDYIAKYGMDEEYGMVNINTILGYEGSNNQTLLDKCSVKIKELYTETKDIIERNKSILNEIAHSLLEKETLDEKDIASFF